MKLYLEIGTDVESPSLELEEAKLQAQKIADILGVTVQLTNWKGGARMKATHSLFSMLS